MQSTKIISTLIKEEKWDDLLSFALVGGTSTLFHDWLNYNENESFKSQLLKSLPDKCISSLIEEYPSIKFRIISFI